MATGHTGRRAAAVPGGRHIHAIRAEYTDMLAKLPGYRLPEPDLSRWLNSTTAVLETLDDPETRRIVVDSEQALRFVEAHGLPPIQRYRMPFAQMYIELTTPIDIGDQEPGYDDLLVAIIIESESKFVPRGFMLPTGPAEAVRLTFLLRDRETGQHWTDRTFYFDLLSGATLTRVANCLGRDFGQDTTQPSEFPDGFLDSIGYNRDPEIMMVARTEGNGIGWWERMAGDYGQFVAWLLTYMTAKGIVIVAETVSRQQRRALARMTHRPSPWHIVTVDPTLVSDEDAEGGGRRGPAFRFDVRGHLRFGRHPRRDGTYSTTVEWVRPHQRGLANAVYVPKTSLYDAKSPRVDILDGS